MNIFKYSHYIWATNFIKWKLEWRVQFSISMHITATFSITATSAITSEPPTTSESSIGKYNSGNIHYAWIIWLQILPMRHLLQVKVLTVSLATSICFVHKMKLLIPATAVLISEPLTTVIESSDGECNIMNFHFGSYIWFTNCKWKFYNNHCILFTYSYFRYYIWVTNYNWTL